MKKIVFEVTQEADGGFCAAAVGYGIFTQADSWDELYDNAKEAVACHFFDEPGDYMVRLHCNCLEKPQGGGLYQPRATPWESIGHNAKALKGRLKTLATRMMEILALTRPYRACDSLLPVTQGVALGWYKTPLRGFVMQGIPS